jgi:hypothetical protein
MLTNTDDTLAFSVSYMHRAFKLYAIKKLILTTYLSRNHWIAVGIILKQQKVYYILFHSRALRLILPLSK